MGRSWVAMRALLIGLALAWGLKSGNSEAIAVERAEGNRLRIVRFADDVPLTSTERETDFRAEEEADAVPPSGLPQPTRDRFTSFPPPRSDQRPVATDGRRIGDLDLSSLLADAPAMFGDFFFSRGALYARGSAYTKFGDICLSGYADLPLAAGNNRTKVSENNKAITHDRVYVRYNHYGRAVNADYNEYPDWGGFSDRRVFSVDTYTVGVERTFGDGGWSWEARFPFSGRTQFEASRFSMEGGKIGNTALLLKRVISVAEESSVAVGMGVNTPTGSSVQGNILGTRYRVSNKAFHFLPYAGFLYAPENQFFLNGFFQLDLPLNRQRISGDDQYLGFSETEEFSEQNLLHLDLSGGRWLFRNPQAPGLTGLAFLTELHYATTLSDGDNAVIDVSDDGFGYYWLGLRSRARRSDMLNFTVGLHAELQRDTLVRVGGAFPLRTGNDRSFDAELLVQLEQRF